MLYEVDMGYDMSRKEITNALTEAVIHYLVKKGYSCHAEIAVGEWNSQRLDLLAFNFKQNFIGVEIKSCQSDYRTDLKWVDYLDTGAFHKFYFCITQKMFENKKFFDKMKHDLKPHGVGIMVLGDNGLIRVVKNARTREVNNKLLQKMILKMAWRGGYSRHSIKRRKRIYLK